MKSDGSLLFARSDNGTEVNEYWVSMIEKAYAKLFGSYHSLNGGTIDEAIYVLTGLPP